MSGHITIVTLGVADVVRSTMFYEALGFRKSSASEESITFFHAGAVVLGIFNRDELAEDASVPATGSGFRGVTIAMNLPSEAAVDEAFARWSTVGAVPVKQPGKVEWGGYSSYVADPDGHLWELAYNPYMQLRDDGSAIPAD